MMKPELNNRPLAISLLGWLFVAVGSIALLAHLTELRTQSRFSSSLLWICLVQIIAAFGGAFMLRGHNWARWLLALWMAFHIAVSFFHSARELAMHLVLFGTIGYFLFRPQASAYFRRATVTAAQVSGDSDMSSGNE